MNGDTTAPTTWQPSWPGWRPRRRKAAATSHARARSVPLGYQSHGGGRRRCSTWALASLKRRANWWRYGIVPSATVGFRNSRLDRSAREVAPADTYLELN